MSIPSNSNWYILYTTRDGAKIEPNYISDFGAIFDIQENKNGEWYLIFGGDITTIPYSAFSGCTSLTSITIPYSITSIGEGAFSGCESLESITIPDNVTSIGYHAFGGCNTLMRVYCNSKIPPTGGSGMFQGNASGRKIYVPTASVEEYKAATVWSDYADDIEGFDVDGEPDFYISYTATEKVEPYDKTAFGANYVSNEWNETTGQGVMYFDDYVTAIGDRAFEGCKTLTSITIPYDVVSVGDDAFRFCSSMEYIYNGENVNYIGNRAFEICESLVSISIPDKVSNIGEFAFQGCKSLTSITIPDGVTKIGGGAFIGCTSLTNIDIGSSLKSIEQYTFYDCSKLENVYIGMNVTSIGDSAFENCSSLKEVSFNNNLVNICTRAFYNCYSLQSIKLKYNLESIGDYAFYGCNSINDAYIPSAVKTIGNEAFYGCMGTITIDSADVIGVNNDSWEENPWLKGSNFSILQINQVNKIGNKAFINCKSIQRVSLSSSISSIGDYVFSGCTSLETFVGSLASSDSKLLQKDGVLLAFAPAGILKYDIPNGIKKINTGAFSGLNELKSINIPNSVESIADKAFYNCNLLESVYCEHYNKVPNIGDDTFTNNYENRKFYINAEKVEDFKIDENWKNYIDDMVPYDFDSDVIYDVDNFTIKYASDNQIYIEGKFEDVLDHSYNEIENLWVIKFNNIVTKIGDEAFSNCDTITQIILPHSLTQIGKYAFRGCVNLQKINIPDKVTEIGYSAFGDCISLPVEDNIRYADTYAASVVDKTKSSYTLKEGTRFIGSDLFDKVRSLTDIKIPNTVISIESDAFLGCISLKNLIIPDGVLVIKSFAFYDCRSLTSVTIPDSVIEIGYNAFETYEKRSNLTSLYIGNSVKKIGKYAFSGHPLITSLILPNSLEEIGVGAFSSCARLNSVILSNNENFKSIPEYAFNDCGSLNSITIPDNITEIGPNAFHLCKNLNYLKLPSNLKSIGLGAFNQCKSLNVVTLPKTVTHVGKYAFNNTNVKLVITSKNVPQLDYDNSSNMKRIYVSPTTHSELPTAPSGWSIDWIFGDIPFDIFKSTLEKWLDKKLTLKNLETN